MSARRRADHRRVDRRARQHRVSHGAADARAAHPPREGDLEHLHRAGAARQHRRVSTPCYHGPKGLTRIAARVHAYAQLLERELAELGVRQLNGHYFDTLRLELKGGAADARAVRKAALEAAYQLPLPRRRDDQYRAGRDNRRPGRRRDSRRVRRRVSGAGGGTNRRRTWSGAAVSSYPPHLARTDAIPHASGLQHASFRNADDALHPQPRAQGRRPRHVDDSARLLHDEAECRVRDAADHLARVLEAASVRAGRAGGGLSADLPRARGGALRDHRLRRGVAAAELRCAGGVRGADGDSRRITASAAKRIATSC